MCSISEAKARFHKQQSARHHLQLFLTQSFLFIPFLLFEELTLFLSASTYQGGASPQEYIYIRICISFWGLCLLRSHTAKILTSSSSSSSSSSLVGSSPSTFSFCSDPVSSFVFGLERSLNSLEASAVERMHTGHALVAM